MLGATSFKSWLLFALIIVLFSALSYSSLFIQYSSPYQSLILLIPALLIFAALWSSLRLRRHVVSWFLLAILFCYFVVTHPKLFSSAQQFDSVHTSILVWLFCLQSFWLMVARYSHRLNAIAAWASLLLALGIIISFYLYNQFSAHLQWLRWLCAYQPFAQFSKIEVSAAALLVIAIVSALLLRQLRRHKNDNNAAWLLAFNVTALALTVEAGSIQQSLLFAMSVLSIYFVLVKDKRDTPLRDNLTELPNRQAFELHTARLRRPYVLALVEMDNFSHFCKLFGEQVGDQALRMIAVQLTHTKGAQAYRYSQKDFALVFKNLSLDRVLPILERVRRRISDYDLHLRSGQRPEENRLGKKQRGLTGDTDVVGVTVSIGAARGRPMVQKRFYLLKRAYHYLQRAQMAGGNEISL